jgi:hypothetical protein
MFLALKFYVRDKNGLKFAGAADGHGVFYFLFGVRKVFQN